LRTYLERGGLQLPESQLGLLWRYHLLLEVRNPELDLTRIRGLRDTAIKHFLDCAIIAGLVDLPSPLLDIGSGAGFPGIVLKIVQPHIEIILAEPRHKRVTFLSELLKELDLSGVQIYPNKIPGPQPLTLTSHRLSKRTRRDGSDCEACDRGPHRRILLDDTARRLTERNEAGRAISAVEPTVGEKFRLKVGGVITRAVEPIVSTLHRSLDLLDPGGLVFFMKGPSVDPELRDAKRKSSVSYTLVDNISYVLPGTQFRRRLVVYSRLGGQSLPIPPVAGVKLEKRDLNRKGRKGRKGKKTQRGE